MGERDDVHLPVADAYNRWSTNYDTYDNSMVLMASRVVADVSRGVAGRDVMEFGCGTGRNLADLKRAGARRLAGFDLSEGMLAQARARDPTFELHCQDMTAPAPFAGGSFDLVLFSLTLEHVADMAGPMAEARRLVRPGGTIHVVEIHPFLSLGGLGAHFVDAVKGETIRIPTVSHRFEDYLNVFANVGLGVSRCKEWRPMDWGAPLPSLFDKRPPDTPYVVEFQLTAATLPSAVGVSRRSATASSL
jgi:malonyl-CoA O-methyltransferase